MGHVIDIKEGRLDFAAFIEEQDPDVLVYDVAPPYEENWNVLQLVRSAEVMQGRPVVVTTTNRQMLEKLVGFPDAIEIVGKPFDLAEIAKAVRSALRDRS